MSMYKRTLISPMLLLAGLIFFATGCKKESTGNSFVTTTLSDSEGNVYQAVTIGSQIWMAENLRSTKLNDGTLISSVKDNTLWSNLTTPGYSYYGNDSVTYKNSCGALYNWYAVGSGKLCPTGWHVPSDADWTTLRTSLGVDSLAGGKLKATSLWNAPNKAATNSTGFSAYAFGYRYFNGSYNNFGYSSNWWSSTEKAANLGWYYYLAYNSGSLGKNYALKQYGFYVRCVKD